jgi:outer membrane protein OmpA-like peptidoglycan-associated protein
MGLSRDNQPAGNREYTSISRYKNLILNVLMIFSILFFLGLVPFGSLGWSGAQAQTESSATRLAALLDQARSHLKEAKQLGAKGDLPRAYRNAEAAFKEAEDLVKADTVADHEKQLFLTELVSQTELLLARARFLAQIKDQKNPWEAVLDRYDQAVQDIALAARITLPEALTGPAASAALADSLQGRMQHQQVLVDSLLVANRHYNHRFDQLAAHRDSALTSLQVEINHLRHSLWDTELRAGMAEADRSAAEADLNVRRQREFAIHQINADFGPDEAEVLVSPEGDIIIRVFGFAFPVGSAELTDSKMDLIDKLATAVSLFQVDLLRVEGHTDNTGSRDHNLRLSRRRAETVAGHLTAQINLPPAQIETVGFGSDRPIAANSSAEGRARNRRIDVIIHPQGD